MGSIILTEDSNPGVAPSETDDVAIGAKHRLLILETRCSGTVAQNAIKKTGFNFNLVIDAQGFSGEIWLMWNNPNLSIQEISRNEQALHISVSYNLKKWFLTIVYANPNEERKRELRNYIANLDPTMNCPWMLCGDFNDISDISEKKGGAPPNLAQIRRFRDWMDLCGFMDLGFQGTHFTWRGPIWQGRERVFKRMDRAISNPDWRICFHEAYIETLPRIKFDHHLILIKCTGNSHVLKNKPFRFEYMWMQHKEFQPFLKNNWNIDLAIEQSIKVFVEKVKQWNHNTFGNIFNQKRILLSRLKEIQNSPRYGRSEFLDNLEDDFIKVLEVILDREQMFWIQKSRETWMVEGDRNTRYYHTKAIIRRRRNKIFKLRDSGGSWIDNLDSLKVHVCTYFKHLFQEINPNRDFNLHTQTIYPEMELGDMLKMKRVVEADEIEQAIFAMGSLNSPGEDGLPAGFYKTNWELVGSSLKSFVMNCWSNPSNIKEVNNTFLALIPKNDQPKFVTQLAHLIEDKVVKGEWRPFRIGKHGLSISHLMFADDLILFGEAFCIQMEVIKSCLDKFCEVSGQIVNGQKTQVFFSKKVNPAKRQEIVDLAGFKETREVGRYLGAYILEGRGTKQSYSHIIDKVKGCLQGWKRDSLSMARKVVLAQSAITPIAFFSMQHSKIPKSICNQVEKEQRRFIWGDDQDRRKAHFINWNTLCFSKEAGGLGLRKLDVMNRGGKTGRVRRADPLNPLKKAGRNRIWSPPN
nr:uncharacterized protein LOC112783135 [Arachis hypogaea]